MDRGPVAFTNTGRGVGVVFSPDLSVPGNCRFYESLGFACFQNADWNRVLTDIRIYNLFHEDDGIRTLILETHGTNGNGLKLQTSYIRSAPAISVLSTDLGAIGSDCDCGIPGDYIMLRGRAGVTKHAGCAISASQLIKI